ncbi:MAG: 23S rRNA (adenine(2503)-C(2))-methyltransferase RlmN [Candidatus Brocadiaceae bacterium]|nr:23S rRNA (adenine(2503)-C(2))-methyltransferase RlmN [Candidatus Brocadiaceae bacterium]
MLLKQNNTFTIIMMKNINKISITGMSLDELKSFCKIMDEPDYRAKQILSWIYKKRATTFENMSNLPKKLREKLGKSCQAFQTEVENRIQTIDGTEKFLVRLYDGNIIESVLLREEKRITACISTQVGCAMACRFCASGQLGLERNLTTGEIIEQTLHMKNRLMPHERLSNIVFMGIGEPLANYDNLVKSLSIINADWGLEISVRHITVSTVGMVNRIRQLAEEGFKVNLAISLHAPDDSTRSKIIPSNKKTGITNILSAAQEYFQKTHRDISFEYILIDGINSSKTHANALARLLKDIQSNINILPLNPVKECNLRPPEQEKIEMFCKILQKHGLVVTLRRKKGDNVNAACGQLRLQKYKYLREKGCV